MRKLIVAVALLCALPSLAWAQCNGQFAAGTICGNSGASQALPTMSKTLVLNQTPTGTVSSAINSLNGIFAANENVNAGANLLSTFTVQTIVNGSSATSGNGNFSIFGDLLINQQSATNNNAYGAIIGRVIAQQSSAISNWNITGVNGNVAINAGITGVSTIAGLESDIAILAGGNAQYKYGVQVVQDPNDAVQATLNEAAYGTLTNSTLTPGWNNILQVDAQSLGHSPINATRGVVVATRGNMTLKSIVGPSFDNSGTVTATNGIDFSSGYTFSGFAFISPCTGCGSVGANAYINGAGDFVGRTASFEWDQNAATNVTVLNKSAGASAQAYFTAITNTANSSVTAGIADQSGSPDYYISSASAINHMIFRLNNVVGMTLTKGGGTQIGAPTGGDKGVGSLNMQSCFINNVACAPLTTPTFITNITTPLIIGGSGTTGTQLTLQTTTGNGTTDAFAFKGGNNGATTFATLANAAFITGQPMIVNNLSGTLDAGAGAIFHVTTNQNLEIRQASAGTLGNGVVLQSINDALNASQGLVFIATVVNVNSLGAAAAPSLSIGNATTGFWTVSTTGFGISVNGVNTADYGITTGSAWTFTGALTSTGIIRSNSAFNVSGSAGQSVTTTVRASGGASDCTLIFTGGIKTGGTC